MVKEPPNVIKCATIAVLEYELGPIRDSLALIESEDTWENISRGVSRLAALARGGAADFAPQFVTAIRSLSRPLIGAINSERSRLSGVSIDCMTALATELQNSFEPLLPLFMPTLLTLCTRTNKVVVARAKACIMVVLEHTQSPTMLSYFAESANDKSASLRLTAAQGVLACLNCCNPPDLEKEARARAVEGVIKSSATDASAEVRKVAREIFEAYKILLPTRVHGFTDPLTPTVKKYLEIRPRPPAGSRSNPPSRPASSQSTHSTNAARAKVPFSSSTSELQSTTANSHDPHHLQAHQRSASSSAVAGVSASCLASAPQPSNASSRPTRQRVATNAPAQRAPVPRSDDMPPPNYIPARPSKSAITTLGDSADSLSSSRSSGQSRATAGPSRAIRPTGPLAIKSYDGPMRAPRPANSFDPQQETGTGQRVVGGARRVLVAAVPPPAVTTPPPESNESQKERRPNSATMTAAPGPSRTAPPKSGRTLISTSKSTSAVQAAATAAKLPPPRRTATATKASEKPKPVGAQASAKALAPITGTKRPERIVPVVAPPPARLARSHTVSAGVTQPTQSQLARMKANEGAIRKVEEKKVAKPGWGKSVSKVGAGATKAGPKARPNPGAEVTTPSEGRKTPAPTEIPLPASRAVSPILATSSPTLENEPEHAEAKGETDIMAAVEAKIPIVAEEPSHLAASGPANFEPAVSEPMVDEQAVSEEETTPVEDEQAAPLTPTHTLDPTYEPVFARQPPSVDGNPSTPKRAPGINFLLSSDQERTPISSLLADIQRGFLFTPHSPISPAMSYLRHPGNALDGLEKTNLEPGEAYVNDTIKGEEKEEKGQTHVEEARLALTALEIN